MADRSEPAFAALIAGTDALPVEPGKARAFTWPTVTLFPYLADPKRVMFLKPSLTKRMAAICVFDLLYDSRPSWSTYARLLALSEYLLNALRPIGARDFIDVQSFMWIIVGGASET